MVELVLISFISPGSRLQSEFEQICFDRTVTFARVHFRRTSRISFNEFYLTGISILNPAKLARSNFDGNSLASVFKNPEEFFCKKVEEFDPIVDHESEF